MGSLGIVVGGGVKGTEEEMAERVVMSTDELCWCLACHWGSLE